MWYLAVALLMLAQPAKCYCPAACVCGCQSGFPCPCPVVVAPADKSAPTTVPLAPSTPKKPETSSTPSQKASSTSTQDTIHMPKETTDQNVKVGNNTFPAKESDHNFGVDWSKIREGTNYKINGRNSTRQEVIETLQNGVPCDATKLRLTIFGSDDVRKRILKELSEYQNGTFLAEYRVQDYDPQNPVIKHLGFKTEVNPTIYFQLPSGEVLHRQEGYDGITNLVQAVRRADPNYNPDKDPDLRKLNSISLKDLELQIQKLLSEIPLYVWILVAALLFFWWKSVSHTAPVINHSKTEESELWR